MLTRHGCRSRTPEEGDGQAAGHQGPTARSENACYVAQHQQLFPLCNITCVFRTLPNKALGGPPLADRLTTPYPLCVGGTMKSW